ncbi:MAG: rod shape-determining protein MreC [Planctomycetota bacterium]|nr:rod shape-determining protein MreC [Planctomycetota bacterium]
MAPASSNRLLVGVVIALVGTSTLLPLRWLRWTSFLGDALQLGVAPISRPVVATVGWLKGARTPPDDDAIRVLEEHIELLRQDLLREKQETARLSQIIRDLQRGIALNPDLRTRQVPGVVYGVSQGQPTLLRVQAGERQGVRANSIAVAPGLQLIGRVVDVAPRTSTVQVMNSRGGPSLTCIIILDENSPEGLRCTLQPGADGTLRGPVEDKRDATGEHAIEPEPGQTVRLDDPTWPLGARMLLVGRVERVEAREDQPLRRMVTVRPTIEHLDRLTELMLWVPEQVGDETSGGAP